MPILNLRALLLAAAACIAAMTLGGGLFPAVGVIGTWRLASTGWRLWQLAGSGEFHPVGRNKDVLRCRRCLRASPPSPSFLPPPAQLLLCPVWLFTADASTATVHLVVQSGRRGALPRCSEGHHNRASEASPGLMRAKFACLRLQV